MKKGFLLFVAQVSFLISFCQVNTWTKEKANAWYKKQGWLVGANFLPSTAINQLEMWQAETFDAATIDKELGWAASIGMNVMRVYLHDIAWEVDPEGFIKRMDQFLAIAAKHKIKILFTIFDDCWNPDAKAGKQPEPKPGIHNSGWVRSPNKELHNDPGGWNKLQVYVKTVLSTFKNDKRILMWDLYNEPGNSGYDSTSLPLLKKIFQWAWDVRPSQPLSAGVWYNNKTLNEFQLASSDVITFHNYNNAESLEKQIKELQQSGRPVICTEYMARIRGSKFQTHLPIFKQYNVAAINWGLVAGKSNTIYQWDTPIPDGSEPKLWFHDIFRKDGTAYDETETGIIKKLTGKK
ncbi:MAG: glycoside hydrolase family 2 TIM barrel-domain containing protein [Chitinophagaceae bacterium]|nr:glycoside hydrolase family 2 TIM barrel-domain containing protein [Chitinophagaceae bacterium]